MNVKDIMTHRVLTVSPDATVLQAANLMLKHRISGLPVVSAAGELVGMLTEGDLLRRSEIATEKHRPSWLVFLLGPGRAAEAFTKAHGRKIEDVMTPTPYTVTEEASLDDVVALMEGHNIKRLPVLRHNRIVGIVSRANLLKALLASAKYDASVVSSDSKIRNAIVAEMERSSWAPTAMVDVRVENGVATFTGCLLDERDRVALKVLAENVPGVKSVRDNMTLIDPYTGTVLGDMAAA
ncbi:MAG: inosine-5'-monophosphate dehydrogenase [Pseudolabrys sp.]|nr:inosine-5'-monophosphate dehydrogenase [Pseudolabrys sp.]